MHATQLLNVFDLGHPEVFRHLCRWTPDHDRQVALAKRMREGKAAVYVASRTRDRLEGLAIVDVPEGLGGGIPTVLHLHCEGGNACKRALVARVVAGIQAAGYTGYIAANATDRDDSVWLRAFASGGRPRRIAAVYAFALGENDGGLPEKAVRRQRKRKQDAVVEQTREPIDGVELRPDVGRAEAAPRPAGGELDEPILVRRRPGVAGPVRGPDGAGRAKRPRRNRRRSE